jgi:hypothetical protein
MQDRGEICTQFVEKRGYLRAVKGYGEDETMDDSRGEDDDDDDDMD